MLSTNQGSLPCPLRAIDSHEKRRCSWALILPFLLVDLQTLQDEWYAVIWLVVYFSRHDYDFLRMEEASSEGSQNGRLVNKIYVSGLCAFVLCIWSVLTSATQPLHACHYHIIEPPNAKCASEGRCTPELIREESRNTIYVVE